MRGRSDPLPIFLFSLAARSPGGVPQRPWARGDRTRERAAVETLCGADEVGRGPLAGPLVAAAVCLPRGAVLRGLDDSKVLTPEAREDLDGRIRGCALAIGWAVIG